MATSEKNLSDHDFTKIPDASGMNLAIVVSEWNHDITNNLLKGAFDTLIKAGVKKDNVRIMHVPGSFELPLGAQMILEDDSDTDAVICLGSVIQGETKHFDFVCEATAKGIMDVGIKFNKPVIFGVLTDNNKQQALDRSGGKHGNKGDEAAITAIKMVSLRHK